MEEALASCAIDGNPFAIEMLELKKRNPEAYWLKLYELQEGSD